MSDDVFVMKVNVRNLTRISALLAGRDAIQQTLEQLMNTAQQSFDSANRVVNDALTNLCDAEGHDLPDKYEVTVDHKNSSITIRSRMEENPSSGTPFPGTTLPPGFPDRAPAASTPPPSNPNTNLPPFSIIDPQGAVPAESDPMGRGNGST